ncbi:unnamed protein product [Rotaria sp. Silwood2]|nr:unnamed protein product [Rotaria sp. Silwood2]CAF3986017.1 unnamed protein product [Rotaria sp. Silwood2]
MTFYLLLILLLLLYQHTNVQAGNSALCFLTERPSFETIEFAQELAQDAIEYDLDVFIMIDDNNFNISTINILSNVRLIQISNQECVHYGYQKTISLTTFRSLHQLYSNTSDLIVPRNEINLLGNTSTWLWSMEVGKLILPWSCSMVNVVGLSRRMLIAIADYVHWLGEVPFHEFFFNTLAMHLNMTVVTPTELSTIVYQTFYSLEQIFKQPNNLWHPFKDLAKRKLWRKMLVNESLKNNNTIQLIDLEVLCHNNQSMRNIEQYLTNLLIKFEKYKSQLSSVIRVSLRQNFCNLAEQCEKQNASKEVISLIKKLADHAYKLPELPVEKLIITKSKHHLKLEQALEENKKTIFRLLSNSSTVVELRKQTNYLIKELTLEIKREFNEQQEFQNYTEESLLSFSFVTTSISTVGSSDVIFPTEMTTMKINKRFYVLTIQNENRILDSIDDNIKILFLIFSFCTLFILFQWKKI